MKKFRVFFVILIVTAISTIGCSNNNMDFLKPESWKTKSESNNYTPSNSETSYVDIDRLNRLIDSNKVYLFELNIKSTAPNIPGKLLEGYLVFKDNITEYQTQITTMVESLKILAKEYNYSISIHLKGIHLGETLEIGGNRYGVSANNTIIYLGEEVPIDNLKINFTRHKSRNLILTRRGNFFEMHFLESVIKGNKGKIFSGDIDLGNNQNTIDLNDANISFKITTPAETTITGDAFDNAFISFTYPKEWKAIDVPNMKMVNLERSVNGNSYILIKAESDDTARTATDFVTEYNNIVKGTTPENITFGTTEYAKISFNYGGNDETMLKVKIGTNLVTINIQGKGLMIDEGVLNLLKSIKYKF